MRAGHGVNSFGWLLREAFCSSGLFVGWPDHVIPTHNVEAIASNKYYVVGNLLAMSLVQ